VRVPALALGAACLVFGACGCQSTAESEDPARPASARRYVSYVQVEGVVAGGAIKLNGSQVATFPGWVTVEVDESGKAVQRYVVTLSTNITGNDLGAYVIDQGGEVPMKIFYERNGPVATGTATVQGRN
jgi:hypothetical protein